MKYLIVMRTFNYKDKFNYLDNTIKSLTNSNFFNTKIDYELHLFDGGSESIEYLNNYKNLKNTTIHFITQKITRNSNAIRALSKTNDIISDYVILLEDDVAFCKNWIESIDIFINRYQDLVNDNPMVSFYTPYKQIEELYNQGKTYWKQRYDFFYGTQCALFRRDNLINIVDHIEKGINNFVNYNFNFRKKKNSTGMIKASIDLWFQECFQNIYPNKSIICTVPSFVQHIGLREDGQKLHQSFFKGEDWEYK